MRLRSSAQSWGSVSVLLHWLTAVGVFGLFPLGLWMTGLTYYDAWYRQAPHLHKSIGVLLFCILLLRLLWRLYDRAPAPLPSYTDSEYTAAKVAHGLLYLLLVMVMISGFLISTADGRAVAVFGWFELPALISGLERQEDIAGTVHQLLAYAVIGVVVLHVLGALKHHFIDRDRTLLRMLGR